MGQPGRIRPRKVAAGIAIGSFLGLAASALAATLVAHAGTTPEAANSLASITPADGAALTTAPEQIVLAFNHELDDEFATLDLTCDSDEIDVGLGEPDDENLFVTFTILGQVPRGPCIVQWDLSDELGATITSGQSTFRVDADPTGTTPEAEQAATDATTATTAPGGLIQIPATSTDGSASASSDEGSSGGALWLGRFVSTTGILVVFGALALISVGWPEGPEYIVTVRFLRAMWAVALVGTVLYLIAFSADATGRSFGSSVSPTTWLDLGDAGWPGRGALLRLVAVAASGLVATRPERIIDPASTMWAWALPGVAVISVALSRVDGSVAPVGFLLGAAHALAAAVWIGGVALVARVVLAGPGDDDLVQATRTFSRVSVPAIALTCLTGIGQMVRLDGGELFTSGHGRVVLLKVIAVAVMIAVALAVRQQVGMRLGRAQELSAPMADRFRRAFGAEATVGVVVLAFSGWLLALTPPNSDPLAGEPYAFEEPFSDEATQLSGSLAIGPSRVGLNGFKLEIDSPETGLTNVMLRFKPPAGAPVGAHLWIDQPIPELTGAGTAWLDDARGIPLQVAGTWSVEVTATTPAGQSVIGFTFVVSGSDGKQPAEQPQVATTPPVSFTLVEGTAPPASFAPTPAPPTNPPISVTTP